MVNNYIYEEVAVLYTSKMFLAYPSVPIHEGHGMAKMVYLRVVLNQDIFVTLDGATHTAIQHYLFVMQLFLLS